MIDLHEVAQPRRWQLANPSPAGGEVEIAGWDFGGDGRLALLHHANGMCAAMWLEVAVALTPHFHVIAIDARGHGDSTHLQVPDDYAWEYLISDLTLVAAQLMVETGESSIALGLGSSFGGIITAGAEAKTSGLFDQIMMLDPPIHPRPELIAALGLDIEPEPGDMRSLLVAQTLRRTSIWPSRDKARESWRRKPLFAPWRDLALDLYLDEGMRDLADGSVQLKCPPEVEAHVFATTGSFGPLDYAPHIQAPVRLVRATNGFFPADFYRAIVSLFPQGELTELEGGHMLPLEVPELVVTHLLEWLGLRA